MGENSKRFDQQSVVTRSNKRLSKSSKWASYMNVGTVGNVLNVIGEDFDELARYLEFLYSETKFRNARTMRAITHQADLVGYKRQLPKSAVGYVIVSHADAEGNDRLANYGTTFFDIDAPSDYDDLIKSTSSTYSQRAALVPLVSGKPYTIPAGTVFKAANGISFISTASVTSRVLKEPFSAIKADDTKYKQFINAGGWDGIKYVKVPVIQGIPVEVEFGIARGTRFESFAIDDLSVEAGTTTISSNYFKVLVKIPHNVGGNVTYADTQIWEKVDNIKLARANEKVFEVKILENSNQVMIKFGDGVSGALLPAGAKVAVQYLSTMGAKGNIDQKYQVTQMIFPEGYDIVDPRTNTANNFLSCLNIVPIMGGRDIESKDDIKLNAPVNHLKSYTTATKRVYAQKILTDSPANILRCKVFKSDTLNANSYGAVNPTSDETDLEYISSVSNSTVLQEVEAIKKSLVISAIKANGEKFEDPENELIKPLILALDDNTSVNDSFEFIQPNTVELKQNILLKLKNTTPVQDYIDKLQPKLLAETSIFNRDFEDPYYVSTIKEIVHNEIEDLEDSEVFVEAKTTASLLPDIIASVSTANCDLTYLNKTGVGRSLSSYTKAADFKTAYEDETLLAFNFKFDKIFANNSLKAGFKNFRYNQPYVVKVDITFKQDPTKNRTLLLLDNRQSLDNELSLLDAEKEAIGSEAAAGIFIKNDIVFQDLFSNDYKNNQVRTAQFSTITNILNEDYFNQISSFKLAPFEIRPVEMDDDGNAKLLNKNEVKAELRLASLEMDNIKNTIITDCYKYNPDYVQHCKVEFNENYNNPDSDDYASGRVILPLSYVFESDELLTLKTMLANTDFHLHAKEMKYLLTDNLSINIYARPIDDAFECVNANDIIYTNKDDILIQKETI